MSIVRGVLSNSTQFKQLLETLVPSIFASVELGPDNQIMCLDADRKIMMEFSDRPNGSSTPGYYRVYRSPNDYVTLAEVNSIINPSEYNVTNYIGCENGIIIQGAAVTSNGYAYQMHFMITKTNNDMPAYIGVDFAQGSASFTKPYNHIAYGDNPSFNSTTPVTSEVGSQTVLQAFATNAYLGTKSVTPKAFMVIRDTAYTLNFGTFTLDGVEYITDGYLAISTATD